jgi:protein associated with RNAse G/E
MEEIRVVYRKYDGSLHWNHPAFRLGEDEHGTWIGIGDGTVMYRGEPEWGPCEAPFVMLMPPDRWWTATFNAEPHRTEIYCDITTVPSWPTAGEVTMIDLDLDVRRRRTGEVKVLDEDEFAEHQVRYGYPAEVIERAQAAADWLFAAVSARREPFDTASARWLAQIV